MVAASNSPPSWRLLSLVGCRMVMDPDVPVVLHAGHVLRRASQAEIDSFKAQLAFIHGPGRANSLYTIFECDHEITETDGGGKTSTPIPLSPEDWRYHVVEVTPDYQSNAINGGLIEIERASSLLGIELCFPVDLYPGGGASYGGYRTLEDSQFDLIMSSTAIVDTQFLEKIKGTLAEIEATTLTHPEIADTISLLLQVRKTVSHTPLRTLGVFAIIERLLTHSPRHGYDSLAHQIHTKLSVLDSHLHQPVDYSVFLEPNAEAIWKLIYGYRSRIAHSGQADFNSSSLKKLKSAQNVDAFLQNVAKSVLALAVKEPVLITNLRAC